MEAGVEDLSLLAVVPEGVSVGADGGFDDGVVPAVVSRSVRGRGPGTASEMDVAGVDGRGLSVLEASGSTIGAGVETFSSLEDPIDVSALLAAEIVGGSDGFCFDFV